jgi:polysaccharide export outer membrane protein
MRAAAGLWLVLCLADGAYAQALTSAPAAVIVPPPADYTIGPDDVLTIVFWRHKELSGDVVVRPDGKVTLPLINDVQAATLTTEQLRLELIEQAGRFVEDPTATVVVKEVHSRKVYITGNVQKAGPYPLTSPMTVVQLIALAGGLTEFADGKNISIVRSEGGVPVSYRFSYHSVARRKNLKQNIELKPGDTIIVP